MEAKAQQGINQRHRRIDPRTIKLLDNNPHFMRHEVFMRLVENIRRDGTATSAPFLWLIHDDETRKPLAYPEDDQAYLCLSGNHRVKASIAAGVERIDVLYTDEYLTPDRRTAIQLSHNAIFGDDDPATLRAVYDSIQDVEMRLYTGLDDKQLQILETVTIASLSEANLDFQTITMSFLPEEIEQVHAVWDTVVKAVAGSKGLWLARWADYDHAMDALEAASMAYGIKNTATALMIVLEVFSRHMDELTEGYLDADGVAVDRKRHVTLDTVLGSNAVPAEVAAKLNKVVNRLLGTGDIDKTKRWQALDHLLDAYLSG